MSQIPSTHEPICSPEDHSTQPPPPSVTDEALQRAASMFKALSDPGRLRIIDDLSHGEFCVSELADNSGDEVYAVSQRLRILRSENLVQRRREGKHVFYRLADCHVLELVKNAFAHATEEP